MDTVRQQRLWPRSITGGKLATAADKKVKPLDI
jgi:hypothetical protein